LISEDFYKTTISNSIAERASRIVPLWNIAFLLINDPFIVAGGCLSGGEINDIDIYPVNEAKFDRKDIEHNLKSIKAECVYESKNALSIRLVDGTKLQFCDYWKEGDVQKLIESFDFWHTQCGILYEPTENSDGGFDTPRIKQIAYTENWIKYKFTGETHYTKSEFPMSSMIRLGKYIKREMFKGRSYIPDVFTIVKDIIDRGYEDYADFKNQLKAVDLLSLEPEEGSAAWELFKTCFAHGLVRSRVDPLEAARSTVDDDDDYYHLIKKD
jgi:hypothetical protein